MLKLTDHDKLAPVWQLVLRAAARLQPILSRPAVHKADHDAVSKKSGQRLRGVYGTHTATKGRKNRSPGCRFQQELLDGCVIPQGKNYGRDCLHCMT